MSGVTDLAVERRYRAASAVRRRTNFVLFLGPAVALTFLFFVIPILIDIAISFTDLDRTLRISKFTTEQYQKVFRGEPRLPQVIGLTVVYVFGTLAIFNVTFGSRARAHHHLAKQSIRRLLSRRLAAAADEPLGPLHSVVAVGHQPLGCWA